MSDNYTNNAIEFLLFSYFNLDFQDAQNFDFVLEKAIYKAYRDAINQGALITLLNKKQKPKVNKLYSEYKEELKTKIYDLLNCNFQNSYNSKHDDICKKTVLKFKELKNSKNELLFTYGNAQKWINMIMKYLYVISGCIKETTNTNSDNVNNDCYYTKIINLSSFFHVPVDRYIMKAASNNFRGNNNLKYILKNRISIIKHDYNEFEGLSETDRINKLKSISDFYHEDGDKKSQCWSKYDEFDYLYFQNSLQSEINNRSYNSITCPIEWECKAWIEQAKKERNKK